jgi:restriction system protein
MLTLKNILNAAPSIGLSTQYWFVRTEGGRLFDAFINNDLIAIGYPKISLKDISNLRPINKSKDPLKELIALKYPDHKVPGLIASQLRKFTFDINKGDYVIIPSASADYISIGKVTSDKPFTKELNTKDLKNDLIKDFNKCISVSWLKTISKFKVNPNLFRLLTSHQAVFSANDYAKWIDSSVYNFYKKDEEYHLVIGVERESRIKAKILFEVYVNLFQLAEKFCTENGIHNSMDDVGTAINLNSPGNIEFKGAGAVMVVIGVIMVSLAGGGFEFTIGEKVKGKIETKGVVEKVNEFLNDGSNRGLKNEAAKKLEELKIKKPKDLINVINSIDDK